MMRDTINELLIIVLIFIVFFAAVVDINAFCIIACIAEGFACCVGLYGIIRSIIEGNHG